VTTVGGTGELKLFELIKPYVGTQAGGDDAAVLAETGPFIVVSTDMAVEGVHFDLGWMTAEDAGWRALALALGDLAAKGANPAWALASVAVPRSWKVDDFVGLFAGMHGLAARVGMAIEGGDMSAIDGPAVVSVTVSGRASTRPLPRSAAQPGWSVGVTGPLGGAMLALRQRRVLRPEPLLDEGRRLNELGLCCGDVSDGLIREMEKFAQMSGCGCDLRAVDVPVAAGASLDDALTSGEEVQLVCVGPHEVVRRARLTVVGVLNQRGEVKVEGAEIAGRGYDHFA
jgi:thiamine-monophosphate kinase